MRYAKSEISRAALIAAGSTLFIAASTPALAQTAAPVALQGDDIVVTATSDILVKRVTV